MTQPIPEGAQSGTEDVTQSGGPASGEGAESGTEPITEPTQTTGRTYTEAEVEAIRNRMRAADQNRSKAEAELSKIRDKDLPEAEKLKRDFEAATVRLSEAEKQLRETRIENAFHRNSKHDWHNSEAAIKLLDYSKVDIDDAGVVHGLDDAIEALAKGNPYLIKPKVEAKDPTEETKVGGTIPGNNGGSKASATTSQLIGRLPALGTRVRPKQN